MREKMGFLQLLENAIGYIRNLQQRQAFLGKTLRENGKKELPENGKHTGGEKKLSQPIDAQQIEGKIAGVDSGFAGQSFYTLDLMLLRSVGVCFTYEKGKMVKAKYLPETNTLPEPILNTEGLEREEFHTFVSLTRLQAEVNTAKEIIENEKPRVCFLDGSIILHPMDKPANESKLQKKYGETIHAFVELYQTAEKNNCTLIGAIEDSRSTKLSDMMRENGMLPLEKNETLSDVALLENVLSAGERSMAFPLYTMGEKNTILEDFPTEWSEKIHACYVKPSQWDYPLRIEFISTKEKMGENAQRASTIALAQSNLHKEYAFPSILIEADLRAGLKPEEVELVSDKILSKLGRHTLRLRRRDRRPF